MKLQLNAGEKAMSNSPSVTLENGLICTPQHFLNFEHTLDSLSKIVLDCQYHNHFPIFAYQQQDMLFVQVGIIGKDNYQAGSTNDEIVYGRKWFIDGFTTTSEIIQTIMLAIQKAKEHEIRELLQVVNNDHTTTPFNCHLDIPLISSVLAHQSTNSNPVSLQTNEEAINNAIQKVRFDRQSIQLSSVDYLPNNTIAITCSMEKSTLNQKFFGNLEKLSFIIEKVTEEAILGQLIDTMILASNQEVKEYFLYKTQNIFSRQTNIALLSTLAIYTRNETFKQGTFGQVFETNNYQTDQRRLPQPATKELYSSLVKSMSQFNIQGGIIPSWLNTD